MNKQEARIFTLKQKLDKTNDVTNELTEAICEYVIKGDSTAVLTTYNKYKEVLVERKKWRDEINALENELKAVVNNE